MDFKNLKLPIQPKQLLEKGLSVSKNLKVDKFLGRQERGFLAVNLGKTSLKGFIAEAGKIEDYFIVKNDDLSEALKRVRNEKKCSAKEARVSIKNSACLVRCFKFPKMDSKKLQQALFYELNKYIPYSPQDVYFDFAILGDSGPNELLILLAVAKKSFVDEVVSAFVKDGLRVLEINIDIICLMNLLLNNQAEISQSNACLLDLGYNFSTIALLNKGTPYLIRDVKFNAKEVFDSLARMKNVSLPEAEAEVKNQEDKTAFLELAQGSIANLCKEMKSSFDYFEVNFNEGISKLYLSGGLASITGIDKVFKNYLEVEVSVLDVFGANRQNVAERLAKEEFAGMENSFAVAVGLTI